MGLILDSSVLIRAERAGWSAYDLLLDLGRQGFSGEIAVSVITAMELEHGAVRADTERRKLARRLFLFDLLNAVPVHPVSLNMALRAGRVDAELVARGIQVAVPDMLIAVTALELNYDVATLNVRHFRQIPGLRLANIS